MRIDPRSTAVISGEERLTYGQLEERITEAAGRLRRIGLGPGDRVGLLAGSSIEWVVLAHAVVRLGCVLVPLNPWQTDREITLELETAGLRLLLSDGDRGERLPAQTHIPLADLRAVRPAEDPLPDRLDPARPATIVFTSGTTGRPRGVILTRANQSSAARACASVLNLSPRDRWLAVLPLFHVGGLNILYRCARAGASVVLQDRFAACEVNRALEREQVTIASFVPVMLRRMLDERGAEPLPPGLRAVLVGGGPIPSRLIEDCPVALPTYGMTETCSQVTLVRPGAEATERRSAGRPLPGVSVRILDEAGAPRPAGARGEIATRGPNVMQGYLDDPEATREVLRDGWLRTGDLGTIDERGCLHVLGRRSGRILSGGETIDPAEIEAALLEDPRVVEAVVVGIPHPEWGETPLALVVPVRPAPDPEELRSALRRRIAGYKLPQIAMVEGIPRLASGKPDREAIRTLYPPASPSAADEER